MYLPGILNQLAIWQFHWNLTDEILILMHGWRRNTLKYKWLKKNALHRIFFFFHLKCLFILCSFQLNFCNSSHKTLSKNLIVQNYYIRTQWACSCSLYFSQLISFSLKQFITKCSANACNKFSKLYPTKNWESLVQAFGCTSLQDLVMNLRRSSLACLPVFLKRSPIHHPNVAEVMHHNYWLDNCVKIYVLMWLFSHIILAIQSNSPLFIPQCDS